MNNTDILQKIIEFSRLIVEFSAILSLVFCIVKEKLLLLCPSQLDLQLT